jgi:hypothetical protein
MRTKTSSAKLQTGAMLADPNAIWKWVYLIGMLVAGLVAAFSIKALDPYLGWLLILAGILSGLFFLDSGDVVNFGIRFLLLFAVSKALDAVPVIGPIFSGFFGGVVVFLGPVGLTLLVMYFWRKYFAIIM